MPHGGTRDRTRSDSRPHVKSLHDTRTVGFDLRPRANARSGSAFDTHTIDSTRRATLDDHRATRSTPDYIPEAEEDFVTRPPRVPSPENWRYDDRYSDNESSDLEAESISGFPFHALSPTTSDVDTLDEKIAVLEVADASVLQVVSGREVFSVTSSKYLDDTFSLGELRGQMIYEPGLTADAKKHHVLFRWMYDSHSYIKTKF